MFEFLSRVDPVVFDMIGVAGFALYVTNYSLLTFHILSSHNTLYFVINLFASALVLTGLSINFNLASVMLQIFWVVISTTAIVLRVYKKMRQGSADTIASAPVENIHAKESDVVLLYQPEAS